MSSWVPVPSSVKSRLCIVHDAKLNAVPCGGPSATCVGTMHLRAARNKTANTKATPKSSIVVSRSPDSPVRSFYEPSSRCPEIGVRTPANGCPGLNEPIHQAGHWSSTRRCPITSGSCRKASGQTICISCQPSLPINTLGSILGVLTPGQTTHGKFASKHIWTSAVVGAPLRAPQCPE